MGSRFQLHVHWWGICYDKLSHIEISWFKGGYPQFTPLPLGNFARLPLAVHQCPFSTQECTPGWKIALRERRFFSNQHNKIIQPVLVCVPMGPVVRMLAITHLVIFLPWLQKKLTKFWCWLLHFEWADNIFPNNLEKLCLSLW